MYIRPVEGICKWKETTVYIHTHRLCITQMVRETTVVTYSTCVTIKLSKYTTVVTYTDSLAVSYEIHMLC